MSHRNGVKYRLEEGQAAFDHNVAQAKREGHSSEVAYLRGYKIHNEAKAKRNRRGHR